MKEQLYGRFQSPSKADRGKPFWSWNGKLDKDELIRQIHVIQEMGFGGHFMHSRTGLVTEYLGEEWFELINACADESERLGGAHRRYGRRGLDLYEGRALKFWPRPHAARKSNV